MPTRNQKASYTTKAGFSADFFTHDEVSAIHQASLEVLRNTGMKFHNKEALAVLKDGGCDVDTGTGIVKIPEHIVNGAIDSAPSHVLLAGREKRHDRVLQGSRVAWTNFGAGVEMYDAFTGEFRLPTVKDVGETALVVDALDVIDVYSQAIVGRDAPPETGDLLAAEAFLSNTTKHCHHIDLASGSAAARYIQMGAAIAGGMDELRARPVVSALICPTSPLQMSDHGSSIIMEFARSGIPINILSMGLAGGTTPVTVAGTLVVHNCEILGGIVLNQLACKGSPVIYGSSTTTFDMRCITAPVGSPELGMIAAGVAALAQFYNLPSYTAGG
jgi:trimethylamine--corrinoid protein Co-methyltransferase